MNVSQFTGASPRLLKSEALDEVMCKFRGADVLEGQFRRTEQLPHEDS